MADRLIEGGPENTQDNTPKNENQQNQSRDSLLKRHKAKYERHKSRHQPVKLKDRDTNLQLYDILTMDENAGFEALKNLLQKHAHKIGKDLVDQLLSSAGSAMDYLTGCAVLGSQANWADQINSYVESYTGFENAIGKMETAITKYGAALKSAQGTYQTVNSPELHLVRVFLKYVIGRASAYVMSLGGKATPTTIHNVTVASEGLHYLADLEARYEDLRLGIKKRAKFLYDTICTAKGVAEVVIKEWAKLQKLTLSQLLAWGWQKFGKEKYGSFSDFILNNNSNIGMVGSGLIIAAALGFMVAGGVALAASKGGPGPTTGPGTSSMIGPVTGLALGSVALGATGIAAKLYDHHYMGKQDEQAPNELNEVQAPQDKKTQDSPNQNRFFWMNMHHTDIKTWDSDTKMENQQGYLSQLIWGKQEDPMYKAGGAEVKFGMGFNIFGRKLLTSNDHTFRLDWGGNFEYKNDDILLTDQLLKFNEAFEIGEVHLTKIRINNQGLQSMGMKLTRVNVAGGAFNVKSLEASWSKAKGLHFETAAEANVLGHNFKGDLSFGLDNDGKLINGAIAIGSGDEFHIIKDILTISNFLLSGSIDENHKVTVGAETDMELLKNNPYFTAKVGKAYVKYDQTRKKPWLAGVSTFDAQIMGGRIGMSFEEAHLKDNQLDIGKAQLRYTKGGNGNNDEEALKNGGVFGDLENIFSIIKTLQVSATVGKVSLSKEGFKFGEAPTWELNEFTAEYAGFMLSLKITKEVVKGTLAGKFDKHFNIFKVLMEAPIPAVPGLNIIGKAALNAHLGAHASLDVEMDKKRSRDSEKKGDAYFKISGKAGFGAGVGLTAGLGASIGLANIASVSGMLMGRFGVEMTGNLEAGATLVFNRHADQVLRQGEKPEDKFRMRAAADVTPTLEISGGLFFNLLQHEFQLAQYSLAKWDLGKGHFAFEAAPDEKGKYHLTPDKDNTKLNDFQFLKTGRLGKDNLNGISKDDEKYMELRNTFEHTENALVAKNKASKELENKQKGYYEALGNKDKAFKKDHNSKNSTSKSNKFEKATDTLESREEKFRLAKDNLTEKTGIYKNKLEQLDQQGKSTEFQMLEALAIMVAKKKGLEDLNEVKKLDENIKLLKHNIRKVLLINYDPEGAVEYLYYYRTEKTAHSTFKWMLGKQFGIWKKRLPNRHAKNSLAKQGVKRFGKKEQGYKEYKAKVNKEQQRVENEHLNVDKKLEEHIEAQQKQQGQTSPEQRQIEQELAEEVRNHVKEVEEDIARKKRTPSTE
ncbi:hypothetical protein [uncultured Microscilla sp.]|uniref:hypothetical protein n=1 Tax=uncultured Microscilla sp. TaxID=432653 RepID=UPI0026226B5E|nr:hypothetical protein [uncultured Microscilla sp.]